MKPSALLTTLCHEGIDFVLIGGVAGVLHGMTRATFDLDIAYATHSANLERISRMLNRYEPRRRLLGAEASVEVTPALLKRKETFQLSTSLGAIDLLRRVEGFKTYGQLKRLAELLTIGDIDVPVLSLEGLIKAKRAMHRGKDVQDLLELESIRAMTESEKLR